MLRTFHKGMREFVKGKAGPKRTSQYLKPRLNKCPGYFLYYALPLFMRSK